MFVVVFTIGMVIRHYTYNDDVTPLDPLPVCGLFFVILSFFPDYSLRSAFRTEMQLRKLQKAAKSRGAAMATSALSIMLPTFVTEKIVQLAKEAKHAANKGNMSDTATTTSGSSNEAIDIDFNGVAVTWEYNHAVLMFAKFHSDDEAFTPQVINMTVQAIEQIMKRFEVMKVKNRSLPCDRAVAVSASI